MAWKRPYSMVRIDRKLYRFLDRNRRGSLRKLSMTRFINGLLGLEQPLVQKGVKK